MLPLRTPRSPCSKCEIKETEQQLHGLSLLQIKEIQDKITRLHDAHQQSLQAEQKLSDNSGDKQPVETLLEEISLVAMMSTADNQWVVDSGCTSHYAQSRGSLT